MRLVGITGTNGKTTTATLLAHIVRVAGEPNALVTTLGSWVEGEQLSDQADVDAFFRCLERARERNVQTLVLETTSQALAEGFAHRYPVDVAVLTNFSRDHLDYHGSPEQYLAAKAQLFTTLKPGGCAVLNADCEAAQLLEEVTPAAVDRLWYASEGGGADRQCALSARSVTVSRAGTQLVLAPSPLADQLGGRVDLGLYGAHFAADALAAALAAHALGYSPDYIGGALSSFVSVPGRFEIVAREPFVVVDYAHTPDALERTLRVAKGVSPDGPLIVVFGCGGDRDPGKRPEMGRVAACISQLAILTSDNPRDESADVITQEIAAGALGAGAREEDPPAVGRTLSSTGPCVVARVVDRKSAISVALEVAREWKGSCVVVAGKGHERVQWIGETAHPFDDALVIREALNQ